MTNVNGYATYDGLGLAELVRKGEVTPGELLEDALAAIAAVNPQLNGVTATLAEAAEAEIAAGLPDGPFKGVPFLVKELGIQATGAPSRCGSKLTESVVAGLDSEVMRRFRAAGFVTAAMTASPEMGFNPTTESVYYGATHNPWDLARSPGGSSGGSAAMIAGGAVPVAHGNDGGGSVRIPASCCGLVGLKPTRQRLPTGPLYGDWLVGFATDFVLTRTVRDSAAVLDATHGPDPGAPNVIAPPERPYAEEVGRKLERPLKIAWSGRPVSGAAVDPAVLDGLNETVGVLESLGHELHEDRAEFHWDEYFEALVVIWTSYVARSIDVLANIVKRPPGYDNLERVTVKLYEHGRSLTAVELHAALERNNTMCRKMGAFMQGYDVFLTPTLSRPPLPLGELNQDAARIDAREWCRQVFDWVPFTPLCNATGQPAISLPLHWTPDGLPIGMHFAAHQNDDALLIRLASQLEAAKPWSDRRPPVFFEG
jgi:amidase